MATSHKTVPFSELHRESEANSGPHWFVNVTGDGRVILTSPSGRMFLSAHGDTITELVSVKA